MSRTINGRNFWEWLGDAGYSDAEVDRIVARERVVFVPSYERPHHDAWVRGDEPRKIRRSEHG